MTTYIGLIRAVNVGGHNLVSMEDLRTFLSRLGFDEPRTLLQSGNIVFRAKSSSAAALEKRLEDEAKKRLGLETSFFVRSADDWQALIAGNPFPREAKNDPARLVAMSLKKAPGASEVKALVDAIQGRETVRVRDDVAYIVYPDGQGTSKITNTAIESKLGTRGTARNWNTVLKLAALADH
ncbi:MAG TPA: DUF1697 domain-containing protein [Bacteroidota bacterium]|nr:DUF1697 domain-containing protein [Bacteroidota bacterium]